MPKVAEGQKPSALIVAEMEREANKLAPDRKPSCADSSSGLQVSEKLADRSLLECVVIARRMMLSENLPAWLRHKAMQTVIRLSSRREQSPMEQDDNASEPGR